MDVRVEFGTAKTSAAYQSGGVSLWAPREREVSAGGTVVGELRGVKAMSDFRFDPGQPPTPSGRVDPLVDAAIRDVEALTMNPLTGRSQLAVRLAQLRRGHSVEIIVTDLRTGILDFVEAVFPDLGTRTLLAQTFTREPSGRGSHFDVYGDLLDEEFPWVAAFNIAGDAYVNAFELPGALARRYFAEHPGPSDEAYEGRRAIAGEALEDPRVTVGRGVLYRRRGLIIPQLKAGPHFVHNVMPMNAEEPGQFIKLLVPAGGARARKQLWDNGYDELDEILTRALDRRPNAPSSASDGFPKRRRCNLD
jgi:hypothetical protein